MVTRLTFKQRRSLVAAMERHLDAGNPPFDDMPKAAAYFESLLSFPITVSACKYSAAQLRDELLGTLTVRRRTAKEQPKEVAETESKRTDHLLDLLLDLVTSLASRVEALEQTAKAQDELIEMIADSESTEPSAVTTNGRIYSHTDSFKGENE